MTAKEILNRAIDRAVINVPPNHRNDFQSKRPDCGPYIICLQAMEEYAAQQVKSLQDYLDATVENRSQVINEMKDQLKQLKEERDSAISDRAEVMDLLDECRLQLEYLDNRFPTGTTANILNRLEIFLDKKQQP